MKKLVEENIIHIVNFTIVFHCLLVFRYSTHLLISYYTILV